MIHFSNFKAVISGDILELYSYEDSVAYGFDASRRANSPREKTEKEKMDIRERSLHRTRGMIRRLINSNSRQWTDEIGVSYAPRFVTLTFAENVRDLSVANALYTNFIKRLNDKLASSDEGPVKYSAVPEFQKRGAVHYHFVIYNLHWLDSAMLGKVWSHGFVKVKPIEDVPNVGLYMTKYLTKDGLDERLVGRKRHFSSRGLRNPIIVRSESVVRSIRNELSPLLCTYEREYDSEYQGMTKLKIFDLSSDPALKARLLNLLLL